MVKKINFRLHQNSSILILGILVFLISFFTYLLTLAPTVTAEDSGELITASYFLGIPHPPGYPTWCILSHPFTYIPMKNIAWRVNLSSAFFASCTVFFLFLLIYQISKSKVASVSSSLLFAFSSEFWEQSVITEVYTLNTLFLILCLYLLWHWKETRFKTYLYWFSFIFGISLGNHYTMFVVGLLFAVFVLYTGIKNQEHWTVFVHCLLITFLSWLVVVIYLPIRSISNPPIDWGNPETLINFIHLILRKHYSFMLTQYPRSLERFFKQCYLFFGMSTDQFGIPLLLVPILISYIFIIFRYASFGILVVSIGLLTSLAGILVQNFNFDLEWLEVMSVFAIPLYVCYCIAFGLTTGVLLNWLKYSFKKIAYIIVVLFLFIPLIPLYCNYEKNDYSDYWYAHEFGVNILNSLSNNAIYIPYTDHASFPILYLQQVEGIRKDIKIGRICGYLNPELFQNMDRNQWAKYAPFPKAKYEPELIGWLVDNTEYPIYLEKKVDIKSSTKGTWVQAGIIYRFLRENEFSPPSEEYWKKYKWDKIKPENIKDLASGLIWLNIQWAKARQYYIKNESEKAVIFINDGIKYYGDGKDEVIFNNAGVLCAEYGDFTHAKEFFEMGIKINPDNKVLIKNLQKAKRKLMLQ
ncbi:MAG TPA: DUF2723 domain-containing protein [Candidatus Hydrogenedens sp.]|nr:DUF2723 domain-containing protein [Candidatus Hydrogenedens sp.]HPP58293.1 DUF2723 domain-containing protein [Candidatus Hydrogenedens sp.]